MMEMIQIKDKERDLVDVLILVFTAGPVVLVITPVVNARSAKMGTKKMLPSQI